MPFRRETIPSMLRRRNGWNYKGVGRYIVTLTMLDRTRDWLGRLERRAELGLAGKPSSTRDARPLMSGALSSPVVLPSVGDWGVALNPAGEVILREWRALAANWPGVIAEELQIMPEHLHGIIRVVSAQQHPLGQILGSFKAKTTAALRELAAADARFQVPASLLAGESLWSKGFQDTILWSAERYAKERNYLLVNPDRLATKRAHPELFRVVRDLAVGLPGYQRPESELSGTGDARPRAHFNAIGNHYLLSKALFQVQCSRRFFAYKRVDDPKRPGHRLIVRDAAGEPVVDFAAPEYDAKLTEARERAACGEVLISPCVSDGERQIARLALKDGLPLVTMANKGFSKLQKPTGRHFDACADGRLLMLAPAAWPYQPGQKTMTRDDATAMNRLCQWLAAEGAAACNYRGLKPVNVDALALAAAKVC